MKRWVIIRLGNIRLHGRIKVSLSFNYRLDIIIPELMPILSHLGTGMTIPHWDFIGNTMVSPNFIRLTADAQSRKGGIWNKMVSIISSVFKLSHLIIFTCLLFLATELPLLGDHHQLQSLRSRQRTLWRRYGLLVCEASNAAR